jgi:hypothetical protein
VLEGLEDFDLAADLVLLDYSSEEEAGQRLAENVGNLPGLRILITILWLVSVLMPS